MNDELKLTPDQKTKIYAINLKYIQKRDAARAQTERGPERRGQMVDNFKAQDAEIEALLTPEQKATFKARKEQMREGMQERRQGHRGGGRGGK